jgi:hypothetical protein
VPPTRSVGTAHPSAGSRDRARTSSKSCKIPAEKNSASPSSIDSRQRRRYVQRFRCEMVVARQKSCRRGVVEIESAAGARSSQHGAHRRRDCGEAAPTGRYRWRCRGAARWEWLGGVAQLGERVNGIHEVRGSIPLASTSCTWRNAASAAEGPAGTGRSVRDVTSDEGRGLPHRRSSSQRWSLSSTFHFLYVCFLGRLWRPRAVSVGATHASAVDRTAGGRRNAQGRLAQLVRAPR